MSTFDPSQPMPLDLIAYKAQIEKNRGLHVNFPRGIVYPKPPGDSIWQGFSIPSPIYIGFTLRGFFYAPPATTVASEFRVKSTDKVSGRDLYASARVTGKLLYFDFSGAGYFEGDQKQDAEIDATGYYSVGIRIKNYEYLAIHFRDKETSSINQREILNAAWEFQIRGSSHHLLSLHLSDEFGLSNTNFPDKHLGSSYNIPFPTLGVGSYSVQECFVTDPSKRATLYIKLFQSTSGAIYYYLTNVKPKEIITFYIRSSREDWLVTTTFDSTVKRIKKKASPEYKNRIDTSFSDNLEIVRKYSEQGAERYDN